MRYWSLFVVAISLASCGEALTPAPHGAMAETEEASNLPLDAEGMPTFRAGLWEVLRTDSGSGGQPERERQCIGKEANADLVKLLAAAETPACTVSRARRAGGIHVTSDCLQAGAKMKTSLDLTGSETAYRMKLSMEIVSPDGARDAGEVTADARWVGACPPGVAPGQSVAAG